MDWILAHLDDIGRLTARHVVLAGVPLVLGLVISLGLGWVAHRVRGLRGIALTGSGLLYTIPSLALFVLMPLVLGTSILSPINVIVAMTL